VAAGVLRAAVGERGLVELDPSGRWLVATLAVAVGFVEIERLLGQWRESTGADWAYTNVYDDQDRPLNWWL
jgi:hypothetical protein